MDNTICYCSVCCKQHQRSEMHSQRTTIYPYKRMILVCPACKEQQDKREALKTAKREVKKTSPAAYCFKW